MLTLVDEADIKAGADVIAHRGGNGNAGWLRQPFETGGDIDAVAEDISVLDDDIAEMHADAQLDAL
ncbi:hypothetical protein D9M70_582980 [compost metagenome]